MTWEPRPLPDVNPETEPFWTAASEGTLLIRYCIDCETYNYYPRDFCPCCFSATVTWEEASGDGIVYTYSEIGQVDDWPESALPLVTAYVELNEGPRILTTLHDCTAADVDIGTDVTVRFIPTERDTIAIPVFEPR